jgi:hypothetical protein
MDRNIKQRIDKLIAVFESRLGVKSYTHRNLQMQDIFLEAASVLRTIQNNYLEPKSPTQEEIDMVSDVILSIEHVQLNKEHKKKLNAAFKAKGALEAYNKIRSEEN